MARDAGSAADVVGRDERLLMVVGPYGAGKTEVAVNLAYHLVAADRRVWLADLDLVNPYFRSREARQELEAAGVRVVVPPGAQVHADLPIVLPEIAGMLPPPEDVTALFDVGGDDVGARVLASLRPGLGDAPYELWQVVNPRRPLHGTVEACLAMQAELEEAARLAVTGLVVNTHLMEETTPEVVLEGVALARELGARAGLPVRAVAVLEELAADPAIEALEEPRLWMRRRMRPPWLGTGPRTWNVPPEGDPGGRAAPAPRPLGRPPPRP